MIDIIVTWLQLMKGRSYCALQFYKTRGILVGIECHIFISNIKDFPMEQLPLMFAVVGVVMVGEGGRRVILKWPRRSCIFCLPEEECALV